VDVVQRGQIPVIGQAWRSSWGYITPFLAFEPEVRHVVYTTNAIEALNRQLRESDQDKGQLPLRGRRPQAHLPRDPERRAAMDTDPQPDESPPRIQDHFGDGLPD
jgi:hypothetical protein